MKKTILSTATLLMFCSFSFGQVGVNTDLPKATLDIKQSNVVNNAEGVLIPTFTANELANLDANYSSDQNGIVVFISGGTGNAGKTVNINGTGFYYYDAQTQLWVTTGGQEPWISETTKIGATSNTENIFQIGQVGIGNSSIDTSAQLDVVSTNKGVLIPRMSKTDREAITSPANGLMIFNTTANCLNYYDGAASKWLSLCGTYDPAQFNLISCNPPVGPSGTYRAGTVLNSANNTYTLSLNITEAGSYQILGTTTNGYSFDKSGVFTQTGNQDIILEGQGTPVNGPQSNSISLTFNGIAITPSCTLPPINVLGATTSFNVDCSQATVNGTYYTQIGLDGTNYIDIPVTSVVTPGSSVVETPSINGIKFSSGSINITTSTTSIRLYGQGTPSAVETNNYTFTAPGSSSCSVSVSVVSSTGTFVNPANRCTEILSANPSATDGYYWVKDASGNKIKTYCDMSNGGWTLVKSLSERQILVVERSQNESIATQQGRNQVTTETGVFNEYAFSVPSAVVNNIGGGSNFPKLFRFTIKEKGHTTAAGATATQVESSTIAPINDDWAKNNYWNVSVQGGGNPATGNYTSSNYTSEGKLFGFSWGKASASSTTYTFNGVNFSATPPGFYSSANFFTGFYGAISYAGPNNASSNLTYTSSNGSSVTFSKYYINDLFGLYMNSEGQLNHHIGTCSNSTDDYGGTSNCSGGWSNWRAHNFNQRPDSNYEGRIVQYWVK